MRIGLTFTAKETGSSPTPARSGPDDLEEEYDSPSTIDAIARVLRSLGHDVVLLGDGEGLIRKLLSFDPPPDLVFNFAEGRTGGRSREACVPAVLEMLGIPYTGSDPLTLAVTLDKDCAKRLVASHGVAVPLGRPVEPDEISADPHCFDIFNGWQYPLICKPAFEGSSKGIRQSCLVETPDRLGEVIRQLAADYQQAVLVEEFISGDELTVGVLGNAPEIFGIMRVLPNDSSDKPFVYSIEVKRDWQNLVRYECPARLSGVDTFAVQRATLQCWKALGCRDVSRFDFRLRDGVPYFLEVNPLPGLSPGTSDLVIMGDLIGVSHAEIVERIVNAACQRLGFKIR